MLRPGVRSATRSTVIDRSRPIRSAITVAGIVGHSFSSLQITLIPYAQRSPK